MAILAINLLSGSLMKFTYKTHQKNPSQNRNFCEAGIEKPPVSSPGESLTKVTFDCCASKSGK